MWVEMFFTSKNTICFQLQFKITVHFSRFLKVHVSDPLPLPLLVHVSDRLPLLTGIHNVTATFHVEPLQVVIQLLSWLISLVPLSKHEFK